MHLSDDNEPVEIPDAQASHFSHQECGRGRGAGGLEGVTGDTDCCYRPFLTSSSVPSKKAPTGLKAGTHLCYDPFAPEKISCHLSGVLYTVCTTCSDICHVSCGLGDRGPLGHPGCCSPLHTHCSWTCGLSREREPLFCHEPVCFSTVGPSEGQERKQHELIRLV